MEWTKVGNRYYRTNTVDEVDMVEKSTYNEETEEYNSCGEWSVETFLAHETVFDGNTEEQYDNIVKELGL